MVPGKEVWMAESSSDRNVLLACVPNFSEGRRRDVIDAILRALEVPGAHVVYRQWDPEHNRLDATVIGAPDAVHQSALAGAAKAAELIDMDEHQGSHPRMGAADVIPFMPVREITMEECVALARDFARELAETLGLPVYCYDRAALSEERRSLAEVRKGEYEGLKNAVARGERLPDFGPHRIGKPGATAVGARKPLIAFNMYLSGADEAAAKETAKAVRESSGGLPAVRAIGFAVPERACATVSMNLVDYEVTGLRVAFDAVSAEAAHRGMKVLDSEIVGLVPQAAIADEDVAYLRLEGFDADRQILERLVSAAETGNQGIGAQSIEEFLGALASERPTPGGGAVAALAGAFGSALLDMVAHLTIDKKGYESAWNRMREVSARAGEAREAFLALADRDVAAFDGLMAAFKLPKDTEEQKADRSRAIQAAYLGAAEVPFEVARAAAGLMELAPETVELGNANAASDAASAGQQLFAATKCAIHNVEINVAGLKDAERADALRAEILALRARAEELLAATDRAFAAHVK
jgi:glutamate formiminotransferase/formiminotetrahydrofolate cyclodeaminase